ncbi:glycine cleavage system aminomethyltransferase GcvT [Carboxydothermus pertinax]|uniref:Aminomethyltransferase n=1 Tax=Carboxydothermus pertinax TaxID=870242 RepID=A0A1L8CWQ2_9THEO|nr:glycine cleavage system aminomethyltransferase GcvT [Carboxydothermus pertinax]GAV23356.1 glycine cleavage system protein T [Carboxydothermus pertinax]
MESLKRTPLFEEHLKLGAKMVPFGGWEMPVQYTGILEEHMAVRTDVGMFDVSHMGEIEILGSRAEEFVNYLITNDASRLNPGEVIYTTMCYPNGGTVDDLLAYKYSNDHYLLVVNASNKDKDFAYIIEHKWEDVTVTDLSDQTAEIALQGPRAQEVLQKLTSFDLNRIKYFGFVEIEVAGIPCLVSRTGYTGEDGFEIYFTPIHAAKIWNELLSLGVKPAGLGARDTLRFEACLPLYGHELSAEITPLEAGLGWAVKFTKEDFLGKEALLAQKNAGLKRKIVGLEMIGAGIPRQGYEIVFNQRGVGFVTSGTFAPYFKKNLALAMVDIDAAEIGTELEVIIRGKGVRARVVPKPFYKRGK